MPELQCKPDWPAARERWIACWERRNTDRPLIDVTAPRGDAGPAPPPPDSPEGRYFDPDYIAAVWERKMAGTYFGGEAVPTGGFFMGGYALGCGPGVIFDERTVWHPGTMSSIHDPLGWSPGPGDAWQGKMERVVERLLDLAPGRFLVGYACQVMANDLLPLLRGSEAFLVDLAEDLATCCRRLDEVLAGWTEVFEHFRRLVDRRQSGGAGCVWGWPGLWHPEMVMITQSDMSCMISPSMFDAYVMREMRQLGQRYGRLWYHLDGPDAVHHLPALLACPFVVAVQYVPGDGNPPNGPAYIDFYRQVQAAGRCLDLAAPCENMEYLARHLRPERLILRTGVASVEQAEELTASTVTWAGSHV